MSQASWKMSNTLAKKRNPAASTSWKRIQAEVVNKGVAETSCFFSNKNIRGQSLATKVYYFCCGSLYHLQAVYWWSEKETARPGQTAGKDGGWRDYGKRSSLRNLCFRAKSHSGQVWQPSSLFLQLWMPRSVPGPSGRKKSYRRNEVKSFLMFYRLPAILWVWFFGYWLRRL